MTASRPNVAIVSLSACGNPARTYTVVDAGGNVVTATVTVHGTATETETETETFRAVGGGCSSAGGGVPALFAALGQLLALRRRGRTLPRRAGQP